MKKIYSLIVITLVAITSTQAQKTDSVIINVGTKSKVIFAIGDKADLQTLKQYNFEAVVDDLVLKLEQQDSSNLDKPADTYLKTEEPQTTPQADEATITRDYRERDRDDDWNDRQSKFNEKNRKEVRYYGRRTHHSFNFDVGINNFLTPSNGLPDYTSYSVRPWGSWYVGINSIERTRIARKFFMEWGFGISWYNFKFENDKLRMSKDANNVIFSDDQRDLDFIKSKLTATYLNASLVPVIDFGGSSHKQMLFNGHRGDSFRIGLGPYAGYRIDSYTKLVFKENGDRHRERDHDNYYLNNLRYGLRLQFGFGATDFFINYDLNEVFATNRGPKLHAFSFGLTF
ncbi:MAG TPA: hypothetical protein VF473_09985 [Cyclobacteriaceae bacterium]